MRRLCGELLESRLLLAFDFGDAPEPYPTLLAEDGARHEAVGPMLGESRSEDSDGVHDVVADMGDDGVSFDAYLRAGQSAATATVIVQNAPGGARLDAWIDLNADGSFGGPEERIATGTVVVNGPNTITFDIPGWAALGTTFARFRVSSAGFLPVGGEAVDGEVEDYRVTILPPHAATGEFGLPQTIDDAAVGAFNVYTADIDSDGDMDVVSASRLGNSVAWYENDGLGNFTVHTITTLAPGARAVSAADVDTDGDIDIVAIYSEDGTINWFENDGQQNFTFHTIASVGENYPYQVSTGDMDGDGDVDVLATSTYSSFHRGDLLWFENDGQENFTQHFILTNSPTLEFVTPADMNGDGHLDVLVAITLDSKVSWFENDGQGNFTTEHVVAANLRGSSGVLAVDMDQDGDMDVVAAEQSAGDITWYEKNDGQESYTPHDVETNLPGVFDIQAADFDGDGDVDILAPTFLTHKIVLYVNDGSRNFVPRNVDASARGALSVKAADFDGNGDLDVVAALQDDDSVVWYENADADDLAAFDFGDAPSSYHTQLADGPQGGAGHRAVGVRMGATRDHEDDAQLPLDGTSDGDDEDGVVSSVFAQDAAVPTRINISVADGAGDGRLFGWIDFNGDGDFEDPGEQVADGEGDFAGLGDDLVTVSVMVPEGGTTGTTFARFRVSSQAGLGHDGAALDGEVEDYRVIILPPSPGTNHENRYDLNGDDGANLVDLLDLVGYTRELGFHPISSPPDPGDLYADANGDYVYNFSDILALVAYLRSAGGDGEPALDSLVRPIVAAQDATPVALDLGSGASLKQSTSRPGSTAPLAAASAFVATHPALFVGLLHAGDAPSNSPLPVSPDIPLAAKTPLSPQADNDIAVDAVLDDGADHFQRRSSRDADDLADLLAADAADHWFAGGDLFEHWDKAWWR